MKRNKVKTVAEAIMTTISDYNSIISEGQKLSKRNGDLIKQEEARIAEEIKKSEAKINALREGIKKAGVEIKNAKEMKAEVILDATKKEIELPKGVK